MDTITISEARATLPDIVHRVQAGQRFTITRHGYPVAMLTPPFPVENAPTMGAKEIVADLTSRLAGATAEPLVYANSTPEWAEEMVAAMRADRAERSW